MPLKKDDLAMITRHKLMINTQWLRYDKHKEGPLINHRSVKGAILAIEKEYKDLENLLFDAVVGLDEEQQLEHLNEWITYSDMQLEMIAAAWDFYNDSIVKAASARLEALRDTIVNEIGTVQERLTTDTASGPNGEHKTLNKVQVRLYNKEIAELKLRICPGMDEALENLCQKDIANAATHINAHTGNMKMVTDPFLKLQADFASKKFADVSFP